MKQIQSKNHVRRYKSEDDNFWRQHIVAFFESKLSRPIYCKRNNINYHKFGYWLRKHSSDNLVSSESPLKSIASHKLLPVQLKSLPESQSQDNFALLCSINLKNGAKLQIHHEQALFLILEKWGGSCF